MNDQHLLAELHALHAERRHVPDAPGVRRQILSIPLHEVPQPGRWLPQLSTGRFQAMFNATKVFVGAVIVAVFGSVVFGAVLTQQSNEDGFPAASVAASESPSARPTPMGTPDATSRPSLRADLEMIPTHFRLPERIPKRFRSGTLETPLGPMRWVHLTGDRNKLPMRLSALMAVPGGWATVPSGGTGNPADDRARLWFSEDLLEWSPRPLPVDGRFVSFTGADGQYWLTVDDPPNSVSSVSSTLWRSDDVVTWQQVDVSLLSVPDGPSEAEWAISVSPVVMADGVTVVPYTVNLTNGGPLLGLAEDGSSFVSLTATDGEDYEVRGPYDRELQGPDGQVVASVRFEETADGLRVVRAEDGMELNVVDGMGMDFIDRWADDTLTQHPRIGIIAGATVRDGGPLPPMPTERWAVTEVDGGLVATSRLSDSTHQTWRSDDGVTWREHLLIGDDPDEPQDAVVMWPRSGDWYAVAAGSVGDREWTSADGITWEELAAKPSDRDGEYSLRFEDYQFTWNSTEQGPIRFLPDAGGQPTRVAAKKLRLGTVNGEILGLGRLGDDPVFYVDANKKGPVHWLFQFDDFVE